MILVENERKEVEFEQKIAVGGGNRGALAREQNWCVERQRCLDAKMHSRYKVVGLLRRGAAKRNLIRESVKLFSLLTKRKLFIFSPLGERLEFVSELERTYKFKRGVQRHKNSDRATEYAMTNVGENFLKIPSHSEDNNILSPKNFLKELQEDLSLNAQDDEKDFLIETFLSRPLRERRNFLANVSELRNFREG